MLVLWTWVCDVTKTNKHIKDNKDTQNAVEWNKIKTVNSLQFINSIQNKTKKKKQKIKWNKINKTFSAHAIN